MRGLATTAAGGDAAVFVPYYSTRRSSYREFSGPRSRYDLSTPQPGFPHRRGCILLCGVQEIFVCTAASAAKMSDSIDCRY